MNQTQILHPALTLTLVLFSTLWISPASAQWAVNTSDERVFGDCILDPKAADLQQQWKIHFEYRKKRSQVAARVISRRLLMPESGREIMEALLSIEPLLGTIRHIESRFLKRAFQDKHFNLLISDPAFLDRIRSGNAQDQIRDSSLDFKDDPAFLALLREIEQHLKIAEISDSIETFRKYDLGILDPVYRKSALSALNYMKKKGATLERIRSWKDAPPLLAQVPLPPNTLGIFAIRYRSLLSRAVTDYLENSKPEYADARQVLGNLSAETWDAIRNSEPPTDSNAFDEHIFARAAEHRNAHREQSVTSEQYGAIDGVARTLWGEASSCQLQGYNQFEAISKIIADRALAIERAKEETLRNEGRKAAVREKNWMKFLKNWVGIKRNSQEMQSDPGLMLRGMADFGRKDKDGLDEAAQVISRKGQFSVWNSFTQKTFRHHSQHPNIPNAEYRIQGPQSSRDDQALTRILCPRFQNDQHQKVWKLAEALARDLVLNRKNLSDRFQWPTKDSILFYTHEAELPFAREVKLSSLSHGKMKLKINGKGRGPCNRFRLFSPKGRQAY